MPAEPQVTSVQAKADNIVGPVKFTLSDLSIIGKTDDGATDIIALDETFKISVNVTFNNTPLTQLLLCLGLRIEVDFAFEGFGKKAEEVDVVDSDEDTKKDKLVYTIDEDFTPRKIGLTPGFYEVAASVKITSSAHKDCGQKVLALGFIKGFSFQVYEE